MNILTLPAMNRSCHTRTLLHFAFSNNVLWRDSTSASKMPLIHFFFFFTTCALLLAENDLNVIIFPLQLPPSLIFPYFPQRAVKPGEQAFALLPFCVYGRLA